MSIQSRKKEIRSEYINKRKALSSTERTAKSKSITTHFINSEFITKDTFHIYISIDKFNEIETQHIIKALWERDKKVVVPKMKAKQLLNCLYTPHTEMTLNGWGILEPTVSGNVDYNEIDIVLVPLLISDLNGNRIGYGGGYYDRFLPNLRSDCKLVGINFFKPIPIIDSQPHDIPLDYLITPKGIISYNR